MQLVPALLLELEATHDLVTFVVAIACDHNAKVLG